MSDSKYAYRIVITVTKDGEWQRVAETEMSISLYPEMATGKTIAPAIEGMLNTIQAEIKKVEEEKKNE